VTRGQLPQRAGLPGLNGGGADGAEWSCAAGCTGRERCCYYEYYY